MALYLELELENGRKKKIPANNQVPTHIDGYVRLIRPVEEPIVGRDSLDERSYRRVTDIHHAIQYLKGGDVVNIKTEPKSYSDFKLRIDRRRHGEMIGGLNGKEYRLVKRYWGEYNQGNGMPWLRTRDENYSLGEIKELEIIHLEQS